MSLKPESVERREMLDLVIVEIEKAKRDGGRMVVSRVAQRLLDDYPNCPMTLVELKDDIARLAVNQSVGVQSGDRATGKIWK